MTPYERLADIAMTDPIYQTQTLFDKIQEAWQHVPNLKTHHGRLLLRINKRLYRIRNAKAKYKPFHQGRNVPHKPPLDIVTYCLQINRPADRISIIIPEDIPIPDLPGGFHTLTLQSPDIANHVLQLSDNQLKNQRPRILIALEHQRLLPLFRTQSSSGTPDAPEACALIDLSINSLNDLPQTCEWITQYGIDLKFACAERLDVLTSHPHFNWLYDPTWDPNTLTDKHRSYLNALIETEYTTDAELARHIGIHRTTLPAIREDFTTHHGPDPFRRALQAGLLWDCRDKWHPMTPETNAPAAT